MKISVSLPDEEVRFVDELASSGRFASRSAAVSAVIRSYRDRDLEAEYTAAWEGWAAGEDAELWDSTSGDGIT